MRRTLWPVAALVALTSCGDSGPTPAPFGLDKRPSNPTCVAQQRPVLDTNVTLARQWAGIAFNQPLYLTQAPGDNTTWYVVERLGKVRAFPATATAAADTHDFINITSTCVASAGT